jgi:DNA polymerase-1
MRVRMNHGIDVQGFGGDTMHMARLWDAGRTMREGYSLESLTNDLLNQRKIPIRERFGRPNKLR